MLEYNEKVKELYTNPRNAGRIENADAVGEVGSAVCGDAMKLYLSISDDGIITDAKFETFGCGSAIASSSALTEMIIGKTVEEAEKLTSRDIVGYLGGLPEPKIHCSVMGTDALRHAIASWKGIEISGEEEPEGETVCQCSLVTDSMVRNAVRENNAATFEQVSEMTGAGSKCGSCIPRVEDIIKDELRAVEEEKKIRSNELSEDRSRLEENINLIKKVEDTFEKTVRPLLKKDGGDIELVDIAGNNIYISLTGNCSTCVAANLTVRNLVERKLREQVSAALTVELVEHEFPENNDEA